MGIKCSCGQPMRYVGSTMVLIGIVPTKLVGIECPERSCAKQRVVKDREWVESLREFPGAGFNPWGFTGI